MAAGLGHLQINAAVGDKTIIQALALARLHWKRRTDIGSTLGPDAGMSKMYRASFGDFNIFKA
jgi:hypothetical protein